MLAAAGRRFVALLVGVSLLTVLLSLLFAALADENAVRAISLGFYLVGSFLLVGGFFVGNRGPVRLRKGADEDAGMPLMGLPLLGGRRGLRWATLEEREEAISTSAILVTLGFVLILIGVAADSRVRLL
jgi:hypothetical protein